jgi:hypothetical protein
MSEQFPLSPQQGATFMTTPAIHQHLVMAGAISWLSQARFDCYPHGHEFMAATSWKFAGKVSEPCVRLMVTNIKLHLGRES